MCAICDFKVEFSVSHPQALKVAVATRQGIEQGLLRDSATQGALANARQKIIAVETLSEFQAHVEAAVPTEQLLGLPDFYVLLIESDTWGFFHPTPDGFDPDVVPDLPDLTATDNAKRSVVMITAECALRALIEGALDLQHSLDAGLVVLDGPEHGETMRSLLHQVFGKTVALS